MTKNQAEIAMVDRIKVCAGKDEDYDIGLILTVDETSAVIAWQSGVRTECPLSDITVAE